MNGLVSLVGNTQKWLTTDSSGNQNFISRTVSISNTFHRVDIVYEQGVNVQFYMDGILDATSTSNLPTGTLYATFYSGRCNGGDQISLKWICIGKYDATPPIVTIDPTVQSQLESTQQSQSTPSQQQVTPTEQIQNTPIEKPQLTPTEQHTASVNLYGEKTDVVKGENIQLKLSAVNLITKPTMHVQVILIPPSGMSVYSSDFVESGAGQYTATFDLEPGKGKDIEVKIAANQVGDFDVNRTVIYYFSSDKQSAIYKDLDLPKLFREGDSIVLHDIRFFKKYAL